MTNEIKHNPWQSMWAQPRKTIREIAAINPSYQLLALCIIYGFPIMITIARFFNLGSSVSTWAILLFSILLSPIAGIIGISFWSILIYWAGKWIKGKSDYNNIRCAVAWSNLPNIATCVTWLLLALVMGQNTFIADYYVTDTKLAAFASALFGIQVVASIWAFILFIGALAEVQKFSILRSIGNILIPVIILFLLSVALKSIVM